MMVIGDDIDDDQFGFMNDCNNYKIIVNETLTI